MSQENKKNDVGDIKLYFMVALSIVATLMIGLGWHYLTGDNGGEENPSEGSGEELVVEDDRDKLIRELERKQEAEENAEPVDVDDASRDRAKDNLEKTDEPVEVDEAISEEDLAQMNEDLESLFALYAEDKDWEGNYYASREFSNSIAGQTEVHMSQQVDTAMNVIGYTMDPSTSEWYNSETEGVYQFLVSLTADGYDDLVFSGNYNKERRVFNIFKMHGILDLDAFAS